MKRAVLLTRTGAMTEVSFCRARESVGCKRYMRRIFWRSHRKDASRVIAEWLEGDNTFDLFDMWREDEALLRDINLISEMEAKMRMQQAELYRMQYDLMDRIYEMNRELERMHDDREELTQYRLSRFA